MQIHTREFGGHDPSVLKPGLWLPSSGNLLKFFNVTIHTITVCELCMVCKSYLRYSCKKKKKSVSKIQSPCYTVQCAVIFTDKKVYILPNFCPSHAV